MISVTVYINGVPIITRSARNIGLVSQSSSKAVKNGRHQYLMDTGEVITHERVDGAAKLAIKMLEKVVDIDKEEK